MTESPQCVYPGENNERVGARQTWYVRTNEFRAPKAGEFYLSGAIPHAYKAHNDLAQRYRIMKETTAPPKYIIKDWFKYILVGPVNG